MKLEWKKQPKGRVTWIAGIFDIWSYEEEIYHLVHINCFPIHYKFCSVEEAKQWCERMWEKIQESLQHQWIKCSDRMPTKEDGPDGYVVWAKPGDRGLECLGLYYNQPHEMTHWYPVPQLPMKEEDPFDQVYNKVRRDLSPDQAREFARRFYEEGQRVRDAECEEWAK